MALFLQAVLYAITDIETTGSFAGANAITEIAICLHDGEKVVDEYQTLINPQKKIPRSITALTGIDNAMVADAPTFEEVAEDLLAFFEGSIFVAHNVNFDYSFIRAAFTAIGYKWNMPKLCTVRLTKAIIKGLPSYSLGNICHSLGIPNHARHRAYGDALATSILFTELVKRDEEDTIQKALKRGSGDAFLPSHVSKADFNALPEQPGVYFFMDAKGKLIYIGKAINLKKRVRSHFTGSMKSARKQAFIKEIHHISFQETGTELIALLLEDHEIRKNWPKYNRAQKSVNFKFGVFAYEDRKGLKRLCLQKLNAASSPVKKFHSMWKARTWLQEQVDNYNLDPLLCGLGADPSRTFNHDIHNPIVTQLIEESSIPNPDILIKGRGRTPDEESFVMVSNNDLRGYGFVPKDAAIFQAEVLEDFLIPITSSSTTESVVISHCRTQPASVRVLGEVVGGI